LEALVLRLDQQLQHGKLASVQFKQVVYLHFSQALVLEEQ
jgi:hypothetical protein